MDEIWLSTRSYSCFGEVNFRKYQNKYERGYYARNQDFVA